MEQKHIFIQMALQAWNTQISRTKELLNSLQEEKLLQEIAPNRNRGVYLIGHLIAIHDAMNNILGIGKRADAELDIAFVKNADKAGYDMPSVATLKQYWNEVHQNLSNSFNQMQPEEWFKKHSAITDEDFAKDPVRNKLNVLINRTNHAAYHLGS